MDECREGRGFRGRLTRLMYHPEKQLESRVRVVKVLRRRLTEVSEGRNAKERWMFSRADR